MCYRFKNAQDEQEFRKRIVKVFPAFNQKPIHGLGRFTFYHTNGFSHELLPVITMEKPNEISYLFWGLVPWFTKTEAQKADLWKKGYTLNARSEEIFTKNSWKGPIKEQRCLVPATGFFEWRDYKGTKYPYLVEMVNPDFPDDSTPFCFAGIYDRWADKSTGIVTESFAIITTEANDLMKRVHVNPTREDNGGRQPVIVLQKDYDTWLSLNATFEQLELIMLPVESEMIRAYTISKNITKRGFTFEDPTFLQHVPYAELPGTSFNTGEFNADEQLFLDL